MISKIHNKQKKVQQISLLNAFFINNLDFILTEIKQKFKLFEYQIEIEIIYYSVYFEKINLFNIIIHCLSRQNITKIEFNEMILGSQSISNDSQNFNDYRYQKALKQISKLINVNREIKTQSQRFKNELIDIHDKYEQLLEHNTRLEQQIQRLKYQNGIVTSNYEQLQNFCKSVEYQHKQLIKSKQIENVSKQQLQNSHKDQLNKIRNLFQQQINDLIIQIHKKQKIIQQKEQQQKIIQQLQQENNKLHHQYEIALKQNQNLLSKIQELNGQLMNAQIKIQQKPNDELVNKLKINQEWIKSLNEENYNLKQKLLEDQYNKEKQKCNDTIFHNIKSFLPTSGANQILFKQFAKQAQKKIKKLDQQKQKLYFKYNKLKNKCTNLQSNLHQNQRQLNLLKLKINGYEQLTQKQQSEIQRMIYEFNKQMDKMTIQNKQKQQLKSNNDQNNSPNKFSNKQKQLKSIIQNLQRQITQYQSQAQQKIKLIHFLQKKIQVIEQEKIVLQTNCNQLQLQLASYQSSDLNKTSKNYSKDYDLIKTQNISSKNGSKIFVINGKRYETKLLKSSDNEVKNSQILEPEKPINLVSDQKLQRSIAISQQSQIIYPTNQISYISSKRNYQNQSQNYVQRL